MELDIPVRCGILMLLREVKGHEFKTAGSPEYRRAAWSDSLSLRLYWEGSILRQVTGRSWICETGGGVTSSGFTTGEVCAIPTRRGMVGRIHGAKTEKGVPVRLTNHTDIPNDLVKEVIRHVRPAGTTKVQVDIGNTKKDWSGHAQPSSKYILVRVAPKHKYPLNNKLRWGGYLPYGWIFNRAEMLVVLLAHEFRHVWQRTHKGWRVWGAKGRYSERDADAYAIRKLREWRKLKGCYLDSKTPIIKATPVVVAKPSKDVQRMEMILRRKEQVARLERKIKSLTTRLKTAKRSLGALESASRSASRAVATSAGPPGSA